MDQTNSISEGKTIKVFLADGNPNGVLTAEIFNWTGKVLVAPRSQLEKLAKRAELDRTGIYVLVGNDPQSTLKERVYVGESDNILSRLAQHNSDSEKDFWDRTIAVISKDENLTKAHVRYLESRIIRLTAQAQRASLQNSTNPEVPKLPESDKSDMEFFLHQLEMLLPVLGFSFMVPVPVLPLQIDAQGDQGSDLSPIFEYKGNEFHAEAREIEGVFVVLAGSKFRVRTLQSMAQGYSELRQELIKDGILVERDGFLFLNKNFEFSSPSAAALIVSGTTVNGRNAWKTKDSDETYNNWSQEQLKRAGVVIESAD
jgi:Domain of unknown function (DUF4357)